MEGRRVRGGFTLVELIVVLALLGMLTALLLPAMMAARETARRTQCRNNLFQIGLALHKDQHSHGVLPPGCVNRNGPLRNRVKGYHFGWMVQILPMLQRTDVWSRFDFGRSVYERVNWPAATAEISPFRCPSYPFTKGTGETQYGGVHHDVEAPVDVDQNGVLFLNSAIRDQDIPDGLSHTAFVGECDLATEDPRRKDLINRLWIRCPIAPGVLTTTCMILASVISRRGGHGDRAVTAATTTIGMRYKSLANPPPTSQR